LINLIATNSKPFTEQYFYSLVFISGSWNHLAGKTAEYWECNPR